jgi:light-regulated signal transduction histidine kinase (bacteriophytochrome)
MEKHSQLLDAKGQHFLDIIYKSTKKVNELIEDLHEFFSVGQKAIKSSTINMEKMINDIITDFKTILPDDVFTVEFSALPPAYGDKKMINQVLVNLFGNAIKYSKPKGAAIITIEGRVKEGKSVYSVKDRGIGFPMECADNIFDVFERLHGSDEFEGTGIGLAIVKRIIQRHGGDVWAEGTVNEGATFYFSLPGKGA